MDEHFVMSWCRCCTTCTECEEEELHLLAFWEQLNEIKLEWNHVDAVLRSQGFSCTCRTNTSTGYLPLKQGKKKQNRGHITEPQLNVSLAAGVC